MKTPKIINYVQKKCAVHRLAKQNAEINRFVRIHDTYLAGDSYNQLAQAKGVIANYAKHNLVCVDIYDARNVEQLNNYVPKAKETEGESILVKVTNLLFGDEQSTIISADTSKVHPYKREAIFSQTGMLGDTQRNIANNLSVEDTFLRNLYRNIENLTKIVTGEK